MPYLALKICRKACKKPYFENAPLKEWTQRLYLNQKVTNAYAICSAKFWFRRRIFFFAGENPFSLAESFSPTKNIFGSEKNFAGENWISPAKTNFRRRKKNFAGENRFSPAKKNFAGEIRISPAKKKIAYLKVHGFFYIIMDTSQTKLN